MKEKDLVVKEDLLIEKETQGVMEGNSLMLMADQVAHEDSSLLKDDPSLINKGRILSRDEESLKEKLLLDTKQDSLVKAKKKGALLKEEVSLLARENLQAMEEVLLVKDGLVSEKLKNYIDVEDHSAENEVANVQDVSKERILSIENVTTDVSVSENVGKKKTVHVETGSFIHNKELKTADKPEFITADNEQTVLKIVEEKMKTRPKKPGVDIKKRVLPVKNNNVLTINEKVVVKMPETETLDGGKNKIKTSLKKVVKNTSKKEMKEVVYPGDVDRPKYGEKKTIWKNLLVQASYEMPEEVCADNEDRPENGEEMKTVVKVVKEVAEKTSEGKAVHAGKEVLKKSKKSNDGKKSPKVRVVKKFVRRKSDEEPKAEALVQPDHEKDSNSDDDGINIIIPSIEEQRKFAEVASHITRLQRFQAAMDKVGLGDALWKCYVLDYKQVWASAWTSTQQEPEGVVGMVCRYGEKKERVHDCRGREWHGQDKELDVARGKEAYTGKGQGLKINRGQNTYMEREREKDMTREQGMPISRDSRINVLRDREMYKGQGIEPGRRGEGMEIRKKC